MHRFVPALRSSDGVGGTRFPLLGDERVVAALGVTTHAARTDEATTVETIGPAVVEAAGRITRELAGAGPTS